jgi:PRTRC genetic system protein A
MLDMAREAAPEGQAPREAHLTIEDVTQEWRLEIPEQIATDSTVIPVDDSPGSSYQRARVEVHSHHNYSAFFSPTDDAEQTRFLIFAVLGRIYERPEIRVRIGIYGQFYDIEAAHIFEVPEGLTDAFLEEEDYLDDGTENQ